MRSKRRRRYRGGGGRRRGGSGLAGPRRVLASLKMVPVRTREQKHVRAARAAAKGAGASADAGSSEPPPWGSAGGDGRASEAGIGVGCSCAPVATQKRDLFDCAKLAQDNWDEREACVKAGDGHAWAVEARARVGRAMRIARGAVGLLTTPGAWQQYEELYDGRSPQRGGPAAVPPRGIEPRPLTVVVPPEGNHRRVIVSSGNALRKQANSANQECITFWPCDK